MFKKKITKFKIQINNKVQIQKEKKNMKIKLNFLDLKNMSDSEFIEKRRKHLRTSKKMRWIAIVFLLGIIFLVPKLFEIFSNIKDNLPEGAQKFAWSGYLSGLTLGLATSVYSVQACVSVLSGFNLFNFNRDTKLMIKYYELLKQIAEKNKDFEKINEVDLK